MSAAIYMLVLQLKLITWTHNTRALILKSVCKQLPSNSLFFRFNCEFSAQYWINYMYCTVDTGELFQLLCYTWPSFLPKFSALSFIPDRNLSTFDRNWPGFDPSILQHNGILGAADEAVLKNVLEN
jgi:hypothetical protein